MESPLIISNTTPIINFAEIGRMDVLEALFGYIVITPAVQEELSNKATLFPQAAIAFMRPRISVITPEDKLLTKSMSGHVHPGEAECLALAMERPGSLLLLDDLAAREIASIHGLFFTGTLGCLVEAKKRGLVHAVSPLLDELRSKARFWISDQLRLKILTETGEL